MSCVYWITQDLEENEEFPKDHKPEFVIFHQTSCWIINDYHDSLYFFMFERFHHNF